MIVFDCETEPWTEKQARVPTFAALGIGVNGVASIVTDYVQAAAQVAKALIDGELVVGHNLAFDLDVLGIRLWPGQRVWDTMLWDLLHRLALNDCEDDKPGPPLFRSLEKLYGGPLAGKGSTQLSFRPGVPLSAEQRAYLLSDVAATAVVWEKQAATGQDWGAEMVRQVRAAQALNAVARRGLRVDDAERLRQRGLFEEDKAEHAQLLHQEGVYTPPRKGPRGGEYAGKLSAKTMQAHVDLLCRVRGIQPGRTDGGKVSVARDDLQDLRDVPLVAAWCGYKDAEKILGYLNKWEGDEAVVRPRYSLLMRTGRTSCSSPNLQQVPSRGKRGSVKAVFVPPPGRVFFELDYGQLELCCLAELTKGRMQQLINEGRDLHRALGAKFFGKEEADITKGERQLMKCANFGLPGGMGATKFRTFLRTQGVPDPGEAVAKDLIRHWHAAYPEMDTWLADDVPEQQRLLQQVWSGREYRPIGDDFRAAAWRQANQIIYGRAERPPFHLRAAIREGKAGSDVERWITGRRVRTTGGRERWPVTYTEQRNTKFQGLAADLAKEALCALVLDHPELCYVHAFVHDSVLVSVVEGETADGVADVMLAAAKMWLPATRVSVEICGPGKSWLAAKEGPAKKVDRL